MLNRIELSMNLLKKCQKSRLSRLKIWKKRAISSLYASCFDAIAIDSNTQKIPYSFVEHWILNEIF